MAPGAGRRVIALLLGASLAGSLAACGSSPARVGGSHPAGGPAAGAAAPTAPRRPSAPGHRRAPGSADAASVRVIRGWADALRNGRFARAAAYFALPARVQIASDSPALLIRRRRQLLGFQALLPCGARLLRADRRGPFVNALFILTDRAGSRCDAPGASARTNFVLRGGRIVEWLRAPSETGDPGLGAVPHAPPGPGGSPSPGPGSGPPAGPPAGPGSPTITGPVV